jgi:hypothetical protein
VRGGGSLWHFHICLQCTWLGLSLPAFSSTPQSSYNFNRFHWSTFIQAYIVHQLYSPSSFTLPHSIDTHSLSGPVFTFLPFIFFFFLYFLTQVSGAHMTCPLFFKVYVCCQRSFIMIFHSWIYGTLTRLTPYFILPYPFLPVPHCFNFQCVSSCHLQTQIQCFLVLFTLYHSLSFSLLPLEPSNSSTITIYFYI